MVRHQEPLGYLDGNYPHPIERLPLLRHLGTGLYVRATASSRQPMKRISERRATRLAGRLDLEANDRAARATNASTSDHREYLLGESHAYKISAEVIRQALRDARHIRLEHAVTET